MDLYETTSKGGYIYDFIYMFAGIRNSAGGAHNYNWGARHHCIRRYHRVRVDDCMDHKDCKEEEVRSLGHLKHGVLFFSFREKYMPYYERETISSWG
jgi:hypothetical protein